jgi:hypothetical protein
MTKPVLKNKRLKSKKITDSARNEQCTLRIPGVCNHNPETTVFAHMNGGGMGYKHHDIHGCYACSDCHDWLDGKYLKDVTLILFGKETMKANMRGEFARAMIETQCKLIEKGLIKI